MPSRARLIGLNLALAAVYALAVRLGLAFNPEAGFATPVWPPAGIALAVVLLLGNRLLPGVFPGACTAALLARAPLLVTLGIAVGGTCQVLAAATLLRRVPTFSITLERVTSVVALIVGAAVACTTISATLGVGTLYVAGLVRPSQLPEAWQQPFENALNELDGLLPAAKELLIQGLVIVVHADAVVTTEEAELLRVICASVHCPMPL